MVKTGEKITVAISSIPNTGKSTLFNALTGAHQSVGNWPGVSVEKKTGELKLNNHLLTIVDLPGAYSLTPTSLEERVVRNFILQTPPDFIINIVDARNLYRSLGLTLQLARSGIPMVIAVNMMDEARRLGIRLDLKKLETHLGMPVVPIVARTGEGIEALKETLRKVVEKNITPRAPNISCPPIVESAVASLAREIEKTPHDARLNEVFLASSELDSNRVATTAGEDSAVLQKVREAARVIRTRLEKTLGEPFPVVCARCRFNAARGLVMEVSSATVAAPDKVTERIDKILLNRYLGLPLFLLIMLLIFQSIYALGLPLQDLISNGIQLFQNFLRSAPLMQKLPVFLNSFLIDGLIQGLGVVVAFFPLIALFFIFMSLIEDSGYMARAAFLMDRLMHALNLDGKAFINILLGYGCNVPAVMGTRILSSQHNRIVTMLLIPFSLCSARLQVFVFLAGILFAASVAPWVVFGLYGLSLLMILFIGLLLRFLRFAGKPEPFIMEVPPYRLPTAKTVGLRAWQEMKDFLYRASTFIVGGVILVWFLIHLPVSAVPGSSNSFAGQSGHFLLPLFKPIGIKWQEIVALIFGFVAKEIVIGSLAVIYTGNAAAAIARQVTPLQGVSFMVFTLLYTPCIATIAAIRAESRSWSIAGFSILLGLGLAWLTSFIVYQGGILLGFG